MSRSYKGLIACCAIALLFFIVVSARADYGYRLWLRYDSLPREMIEVYRPRVTQIVVPGHSATLDAIRTELVKAGVDAGRVDTVSFGRDRPVDTGHSEASHRKNRRGEFVVLTPPK